MCKATNGNPSLVLKPLFFIHLLGNSKPSKEDPLEIGNFTLSADVGNTVHYPVPKKSYGG